MALSIYFQIYLGAAMASFQVLVNTFPQPQTSNALFLSGDSTEGILRTGIKSLKLCIALDVSWSVK